MTQSQLTAYSCSGLSFLHERQKTEEQLEFTDSGGHSKLCLGQIPPVNSCYCMSYFFTLLGLPCLLLIQAMFSRLQKNLQFPHPSNSQFILTNIQYQECVVDLYNKILNFADKFMHCLLLQFKADPQVQPTGEEEKSNVKVLRKLGHQSHQSTVCFSITPCCFRNSSKVIGNKRQKLLLLHCYPVTGFEEFRNATEKCQIQLQMMYRACLQYEQQK